MVSKRTVSAKFKTRYQKKSKYETTSSNSIDKSKFKQELVSPKIKSEPKDEIQKDCPENRDPYIDTDVNNKCNILSDLDVHNMTWRKLACTPTQLRLDIVLKCGQSFRWTTPFKDRPDEYVGVLNSKLWILKQEPDHILYKTLEKKPIIKAENKHNLTPLDDKINKEDENFLRNYFQLDVDLEHLYSSWKKVDPVFDNIAKHFIGVRILRQDPVENIFSFICSSNNNIQRISGMVENLCTRYGEEVAEIKIAETSESTSKIYYSFPTIDRLCESPTDESLDLEQTLRSLSFGYRASYIAKSAKQIQNAGGYEYLLNLRSLSYDDAKIELLKLTGIGPKVADCILLMSLDKPSSIPVDTHMFQIAAKKYLPHLRERKSVTDKVYAEIADHWRGLYGEYAGWTHSVLFSADLRHFQDIKSENKVPKNELKSSNKKVNKNSNNLVSRVMIKIKVKIMSIIST